MRASRDLATARMEVGETAYSGSQKLPIASRVGSVMTLVLAVDAMLRSASSPPHGWIVSR
jgi:hypothetical protein